MVVNPTATPLITHGQNTARGQWPWHIALYRIEGINLSYSCGGSLVSSLAVVTGMTVCFTYRVEMSFLQTDKKVKFNLSFVSIPKDI